MMRSSLVQMRVLHFKVGGEGIYDFLVSWLMHFREIECALEFPLSIPPS